MIDSDNLLIDISQYAILKKLNEDGDVIYYQIVDEPTHQKYIAKTIRVFEDKKANDLDDDVDTDDVLPDFVIIKKFMKEMDVLSNQINQTLSVGTPIYMAPEVLDDVHYSNKIDVYSYSMILYELLLLKTPWSDKKNITTFNLFTYVKNKVRPIIYEKEIPDIWVELIEKCWHHDPNQRPSFIQIVKVFWTI